MKLQKLIKNNLKDKQFTIAIGKLIETIYLLICALLITLICNFIKNSAICITFIIVGIIITSITSIKITNIYFKFRNKLLKN